MCYVLIPALGLRGVSSSVYKYERCNKSMTNSVRLGVTVDEIDPPRLCILVFYEGFDWFNIILF